LDNHQGGYYYLEFGVHQGCSINQFSQHLQDIVIYGFDSFEGLNEDWKGTTMIKQHFSLDGVVPQLNSNCIPVIGWIQDTLPTFISSNEDLRINFVHIDTDTYETARFILEHIKPFLIDKSILVFDELYNIPGWRIGEYRALTEIFNETEYQFLAFSINGGTAVIQYNKASG
jgi:hypothetical protein